MGNTKKRSREHLTIDERKEIERSLYDNMSFASIARTLDKSPSTISREVYRNRRSEGPSSTRAADNTDCEHLRTCKIKGLCGHDYFCKENTTKLCKRCEVKTCHDLCDEYEKRLCPSVEHAPFVCNACKRYTHCTTKRFRYSAESAQAHARQRNTESRCGFNLTSEEVAYLIEVVRAGLSLGHPIHHIFQANDLPCSERTFYRLVENESIPILNIQLAKKVKYKKRKVNKATPAHPKGFYKGHEYSDYLSLPLSERVITTEVDTVWGKKKDRKTILSLHRIDLRFQVYLLLQSRTTEQVIGALDWLEACCEGHFAEIFGLLLLDRGTEFDDIEGIEHSCVSGATRTRAFYTDPSRPDQKGSCEKNHVELRKIVPKGTSLEAMNAATLADICSHVNSTIRKGCGNSTPIQLAMMCLPQELFDNLGLRYIPPNEVIATPNMLYIP